MRNVFLKAEWRKLLMINYEVEPDTILPYLPAYTEPDLYDGKCLVSIVGFMFLNTRVKGLKIFNHINFEEVNLRFYNTFTTPAGEIRRGTTFIKEIVSKPAIAFIANSLYKEKYVTLPMGNSIQESHTEWLVEYRWKFNKHINSISCVAGKEKRPILENSLEDFITEHYRGYTKLSLKHTSEYAVEHPRWETYPVKQFNVNIDFEGVYGSNFANLQHKQPHSVLLVEGSEILVRSGIKIGQ